MFHFFKKKKSEVPKKEERTLTNEEKQQIRGEIQQIETQIDEGQSKEELAKQYETIGLLFMELAEIDLAIVALEKSLSHKKSIGEGYKKLMSAYNQKRGEAARAGDDEGIERWMDKMDEMRQIAKKVTISGS